MTHRPALTPGQRIVWRFANGWFGLRFEREEKMAQAIDRAIKAARKDARAENERLRADLATQQGCCDGAAAQDAHVRREREEHRAEVERLRAALRAVACDCELDSQGRRSCVAENLCAGECPHLTARDALEDGR